MDNKPQRKDLQIIKAGILMGSGGILFVLGLLTFYSPKIIPYLSVIQGIGLFLFVIGLWQLIQHFRTRKNPEMARKARVESSDERKLWIQSRAGSNAYKFGITATYLALLFVGATDGAISSDLAWWVLAGIVVGTLLVYIVSLVRYEQLY